MKVIVIHDRAYETLNEMLNRLRLHFEHERKLAEDDLKLLNILQRYISDHTESYKEYSESMIWSQRLCHIKSIQNQ